MGKGMLRGCQGPGARRAVGRGPGEGRVGRVDRKDGGGEGGNVCYLLYVCMHAYLRAYVCMSYILHIHVWH